ncbi:MAG: tetratricopeptide repeat protein [Desulfobacteraceae bacterium]|nr:tetratricopeptide repeat protein [Desulfobacteraceae bacterium]
MTINSLLKKAVGLHKAGNLQKALSVYQTILNARADHPDALHLSGLIAHQCGDHEKAQSLIRAAIRINPKNSSYYNNLGAASRSAGDFKSAEDCYGQAIALEPDYTEAWYNLGSVKHAAGNLDRAVECYSRAIRLNPRYIDALNNLAAAYNDLGKPAEAISCCRKIIGLDAGYAQAFNNLGNALKTMTRYSEAQEAYQKAIALMPDQCEFYNNLANVHMDNGNLKAAVELYQKSISLNSKSAESFNGLGTALKALGNHNEALACFKKSVGLRPDDYQGYHNMGNTFLELQNYPEAISCYGRAIHLNPRQPEPYLNMGFAHRDSGHPDDEYQAYRKALQIDPDYEKTYSHILHHLMQACDWESLGGLNDKLDWITRRAIRNGKRPEEMPFLNLARTDDVELNYRVARSWSLEIEAQCSALRPIRQAEKPTPAAALNDKYRITIGYLSNNFKNHPTAHLTAGIFKRHDRGGFKVNCYSYGEDDKSDYRRTIQATCDHFVDLQGIDHLTAARIIADDGVDLLIDLVGYMKGHRLHIPALRPAPIQIRWLGMAGTTGAGFFDYLLTHPIVTPENHEPYFSEAFAYLPDCYQVNDQGQKIADDAISRDKMGLPPSAFVFCCFCTHYKINPEIFDVWMKILKSVPDSVLWLLEGKGRASENLRRAARSHGVADSRLVFAKKTAKAQHLQRLQLADLALDTPLVNGAATTSDALWAGVPVISIQGNHFASRMSACILSAIGLSELVARDLEGYETLAQRLATQPHLLSGQKEILHHNRTNEPLFDTAMFVKHLETAYRIMWEKHQKGDKPTLFHAGKR